MLTPKFKLTQDHEHLFLWMHVPYIKYDEAECEISDDNVLFFSASPYYLRLHLPGEVLVDTGPSHYDIDSGDLTINLKKKNPGESFEGLDMLTWLLTPRKTKSLNPSIEVINTTEKENTTHECDKISQSQDDALKISQRTLKTDECDTCNSTSRSSISDDATISADNEIIDEMDWFIEQKINEPEAGIPGLEKNKTGCGFALRRFDFDNVSSEAAFLIDVKDPNNLSISIRQQLREEQENSKFDCEHYLADLFDDDMIKEVLVPSYPELIGTDGVAFPLNDKEIEKLIQLPKREYLIDSEMLSQIYFGLVDLMFAYAYNFRFAHGEDNVEADWTICKLSSTLSWFDSFCNLKDVVVACARRILCFPLYRSWLLFEKIFHDVSLIFKCGKNQILKCLLGIHFILQKSEDRYVLNDLYITDYCVWIQSASSDQIVNLASELSELEISKADIDFKFKLLELEADARLVMEESDGEEDDVDVLADRVKKVVNVCEADGDSDDDDEDEDDDEHDDEEDDDEGDDDDDDDDDEEDDDDDDDDDDEGDDDDDDDDDEEDDENDVNVRN